MKGFQVCVLLACCWGCGDDGDGGREADGESGDAGKPAQNGSILSASATSYTEGNEAGNSTAKGAEATGYTLETANGLSIRGTFEAASTTADSYRFNAGTLGKAGAPGSPGVDIRLVIDGDRTQRNTPLGLSLDTVVEKGYSSLTAGNYFINAALIKGEDYVITVQPGSAGKSYVLEVRGHSE